MRLILRKYEIAIIRELIADRVNAMKEEGVNPNAWRLMALLDKRIMRQEEIIERRKKCTGFVQNARK